MLIGFITVLRAGVGLVANLFDDTAQKQEYEDKLVGLVLFDPMPFDGIENIDDLTMLEAAVWGCDTDDQGWRIEIKKYPLLTEKGAWRKFNSHDRECIRQSKTNNNPVFSQSSSCVISLSASQQIYS